MSRFIFAFAVICLYAWGAYTQLLAANTLVPSRIDLCAGDTFSLALTSGAFSGVGREFVVLRSADYGGLVDTLPYAQLGDKLTCQLRKTTVGSTNYSIEVVDNGLINTSSSIIRIFNPLTGGIADSSYSFCFKHNGRLYFKHRHKATHTYASSLAHRSGGKLVTIYDSIINSKLAAFSDTGGFWFDLSDRLVEGTWRRYNMQPNYYSHWDSLELNNAGGHEDYAVIYRDGYWNDEFLERNKGHFLEINTIGGDTIFTVPGGSIRLAAPAIPQTQVFWFGQSNFFSSDTILNIPRIYIPSLGPQTSNFGLIIRKDGCQSDLLPFPILARTTGLDTSLFLEGPSFRGHRYYVSKFNVDVFRASEIAYSLGGIIAEVRDLQENSIVMAMRPNDEKWIGLSDTAEDRIFRFLTSDTIATFTNWAPTEPNNHLGREPYVEMRANGRWNDIFPELSIPFAIQVKETVTIDEPTELIVCPTSSDSIIFHSMGSVLDCRLEISDGNGSFSPPTRVSFTSTGDKVYFKYPLNLAFGTGYKLRLIDTVRGLYDYPNTIPIEVSNGSFIKPLLAQVEDSIYILNPYPSTEYNWLFNGVSIPSAGLYVIPTATGDFTVSASHNACEATSESLHYITTMIKTASARGILLYPNPASKSIALLLPGSHGFHYCILDMNGRTVISAKTAEQNVQVDLNQIKAGIYQVLLQDGSNTYRKKLTVR